MSTKQEVDALFEEWLKDEPRVKDPTKSAAQTGKKHTLETKLRMSASHKARGPRSVEHSRNIGLAQRGKKKGPLPEEVKRKLSEANVGFVHKKITCPHCGTEGGETSTKRWHLDHCQYKDPEILKRYEAAYREGMQMAPNYRLSWQPAAHHHSLSTRSLVQYVEHIRAFIRSKK